MDKRYYEFDNELELNRHLKYWCNACGELHHYGEYDLKDVSELPEELQRAFTELWREGSYGVRCYLVEFNGKYGISFEAWYDKCYAHDVEITYDELVKIAREKAIECSKKYPEYDVIFGKDAVEWSDGSKDTVVAIVMPWDISKEKLDEIGKYFESMCYEITR